MRLTAKEQMTLHRTLEWREFQEITTTDFTEQALYSRLSEVLAEVWKEHSELVEYHETTLNGMPAALKPEYNKTAIRQTNYLFTPFRAIKSGVPTREMSVLMAGTVDQINADVDDPLSLINQTQFKKLATTVEEFVSMRGQRGDLNYVYPVFIGEF